MSAAKLAEFVRQHPACSPLIALASLLSIPLSQVLFPVFRNPGTMTAILLGFSCAVIGLVLGCVGVAATAGEPFSSRLPAASGIFIGGFLALIFAAILFLMLTPNAPL